MQLVSAEFFIFLPIVVAINFIVPRKFKYIWLFITSLFFYASIDVKSTVVLVIFIALAYGFGLLLEKNKQNTAILSVAIAIHIAVLVACKYLNFIEKTFLSLTGRTEEAVNLNLLATLGISFYMLKIIGYLIDVYRGDLVAEKNPLKVGLYVSFFPQITQGPIERAKNMLPQFNFPLTVDYDMLRDGILEIIWGYFLKLVVADRLAIYVNNVYANPMEAVGFTTLVATVFYTFEIYTDFAGYTHIAIGISRLLGIDVMENFKCPYLASSIAGYWRRWHISLSTWLRDYLYIPLGGNRKGTARKYLNIMIVFLVSGLWHGAGWTFVVWGLLHGLFQVIGYILKPVRDWCVNVFKVERNAFSHRVLKVLVTFLLVNFAWVFFRASSLGEALVIIKNSLVFTPWMLADGSLYKHGLDSADFFVAIVGLIIVVVTDLVNYNGFVIRERILKQGIWIRYIIVIAAIISILVFGIWGPGYDSAAFIYQQF
ncbi:D-alanyl-lipoteichoic acid acyltransferase DltB, MBOAT superfamily [Butyrivibrio sp. Su6]|uniref:MBOAT family O-acyltransferase n=1 Tax=Butyrivibrio sp. Su6 TaxID=1520810 RepID=UPI00089E2A8A|nr:MBOAT family O-acyltransferase [Butyrivibrio sp. Su6]SEG46472.1 D-alanyl-lipoteichoic acid acyltransferase DltB, MBOAT superfamily [Butyrivibrio sp. Su6]